MLEQAGDHTNAARTTLASFERVADALYAVRRGCESIAVLAILWMHPKHPIHPVQEALMRADVEVGGSGDDYRAGRTVTGTAGTAVRLVGRAGLCVLNAVRLSFRLLGLRWLLRRELRMLKRQRFDIVVKTWSFGPAQPADAPDFYYGDLQRRLGARGVRALLLCGNADNQEWRGFAKSRVSAWAPCRLPEMCLVHPLTPYVMVFEQLLAAVRLRRLAVRAGDFLVKRASRLASEDCLSRATTELGLFFWIGRNAAKIWRPRAFVSLYEGHGWEKCAWWGAKVADPSCKTVGYQHTVIFPQTISLRRPNVGGRAGLTPDIVLCLGDSTRRMIEAGHRPGRSQVITFGSFRRMVLDDVERLPRPQQRTVLVLPEGYLDQEEFLFGTAMRVAAVLPDHHFIFRCHPFLPFRHVRPLLEKPPEEFPNIEISDGESVVDDFARSSVVLYRGSSSALYAVLYGLKPIYLHDGQPHEVDALFELNGWRERATSIRGLTEILRRYAAAPRDRAAAEWRAAADYVEAYTAPVSDAAIDRFLDALERRSWSATG